MDYGLLRIVEFPDATFSKNVTNIRQPRFPKSFVHFGLVRDDELPMSGCTEADVRYGSKGFSGQLCLG